MATIRRSLKNAKHGFAPCERDVREATSNDKRLASAVVMARISNATYDVTQSPLVMAMLWKRLNDMGKNWRHCYKGLLLLDYLLKTGADHVVTEVKTNKFAIETLLEFQYVDSRGVDKGINVREQAKLTMALLSDDAKLQEERDKATAAHRRLTQNAGHLAQPKPIPAARASTLAKRGNVMPNGDVPIDPREEERRQLEAARQASAAEYAARRESFPAAAAPGPGATEEEQLAYALQISAIEASSPPSARAAPQRGDALSEREEEELALALSLSLQETRGNGSAARIVDSDDESDADSITPPTTPYTGELFDAAGDALPSYDDAADGAAAASPEFGITPNYSIPNRSDAPSHGGHGDDAIGMDMHANELEMYLELEASLGDGAK